MSVVDVVASASYKPGWSLSLRTMHGTPHLWIEAKVPDSTQPEKTATIGHVFQVPPWFLDRNEVRDFDGRLVMGDFSATRHQMRRWVREQIGKVEAHEIGEFLSFGGEKPFYPAHGDEGDPYSESI